MEECRFRDRPGHVCARRDGRAIAAGDPTTCHAEARAQVADLVHLKHEVDHALVLFSLGGEAA